jgi:group II intron reverse transcriptase/maturase
LLELVAAPENLVSALAKVVSNKGAPGVDRRTVEEVERHANVLLPKLSRALLTETYVPGDIRRVWIPKPGGGQRGLGIPNVVDRWVQQAVLHVLEPVYDPTFHPSSHGFRPGRGAQTAIAEACGHIRTGLGFTVDLDLEKFFDRVNHQRLLDRLGQRVHDARVLRIIRLMLKAKVVLPDGTRVSTEEGTPQGGPLSPLLSNIVLDELDRELERRSLHFVRYADDCNIYVGSKRAGERVMASVRQFIERRLRLKVNEAKSAVDLTANRHFLGFRLGTVQGGQIFVRLSERSHQRIYERFRELTPRNWGSSLNTCIGRINQYVVGWSAYFRLCTSGITRQLKQFDAHIRRRLRAIIVRQKKRNRHLFRHLCGKGVPRPSAWKASFSRRGPWRQSKSDGMHKAYPNRWFDDRVTSFEEQWWKIRFDWRTHFGMAA